MTCFMAQNNLSLSPTRDKNAVTNSALRQFTYGHIQTCTSASISYEIIIMNKNRTLIIFSKIFNFLYIHQMTKFSRTPIISYRCKWSLHFVFCAIAAEIPDLRSAALMNFIIKIPLVNNASLPLGTYTMQSYHNN